MMPDVSDMPEVIGEFPGVSREDIQRSRHASGLLRRAATMLTAQEAIELIASEQPHEAQWMAILALARRLDEHVDECGGGR